MKKIVNNSLSALLLSGIGLTLSCSNDDGVSSDEVDPVQLEIDIEIIDEYLTANNINAEIHESGIRYIHNTEGSGDSPELGDNIATKFVAVDLLEGDTLGQDTIGFTITLSQTIIKAWQFMVPEMKEGGVITIYTPSGYVFGATGAGSIGPNTNLIYHIELLARVDDEEEQLAVEQLIIDEFLLESGIQANEHPSGIRYVHKELGDGESPDENDNVTVRYTGSFLSGEVFEERNTNLPVDLSGLIPAWKIMIPEMSVGGKLVMYAPSEFCYGPQANGSIPANSTLVYEVELISIN